jgi:hypothetical protein
MLLCFTASRPSDQYVLTMRGHRGVEEAEEKEDEEM